QQIGTPGQIYDDPANLFVAGFIGSPPMNFLEGELIDGKFVFATGDFDTSSLDTKRGVTAGLRAEDCQVTVPSEGKIEANVYAVELMGDHTLVTCKVGDATGTVMADQSAHHDMDESIGISFALPSVF